MDPPRLRPLTENCSSSSLETESAHSHGRCRCTFSNNASVVPVVPPPWGSEADLCVGPGVGFWRGARLYTTPHPSEPLSCVSFRGPLTSTRAAQTTCDNMRRAPKAAAMATPRSAVKRNEYTVSRFRFKQRREVRRTNSPYKPL